MIRTVLRSPRAAGTAVVMGHVLPDLANVSPAATPGETIDGYFQQVQFPAVLKASFLFLLGAFLLGWPACRSRRARMIQEAVDPAASKDVDIDPRSTRCFSHIAHPHAGPGNRGCPASGIRRS